MSSFSSSWSSEVWSYVRVNGERHCQKDVFSTRPSSISLTTPPPPRGLVCWPLHIESDRSVIRLPHLPLMMSHLSQAVFPARTYPSFCSMKQLEVLSLIPPGGDPTTYKYCQVGLTVSWSIYCIILTGERHSASKRWVQILHLSLFPSVKQAKVYTTLSSTKETNDKYNF